MSRNNQPAIVQECGAVYRTRTVENHNQTDYHKEALKSSRLRALPPEKVYDETPMGIMVSSANEKLENKMGALMLQFTMIQKINSFSVQLAKQNCGSTNGK